jgi:Flp pilus assembly protein TadG
MTYADRRSQRGMTLMVVCLLLVCFLVIAALCIDLGVFYTARTSAQHAADAAALAGAFTFVNTPTAAQPAAAQQSAIAVAAANKILGQSVTVTPGDITVDTTNRRVTVTVARLGDNGIGTFFAKAIGVTNVSVQTQATAQASRTAGGSRCIKPIYIPNTVLSAAATTQAACDAGEVLFDPHNPGQFSAWAKNTDGNFKYSGMCATIRPTSPADVKKGDFSPGQFFSLDFGSGGSTYRCVWSSCLNDIACNADQSVIACGKEYPVKTGDMVGPTKQGVGDLIGDSPDTWVDVGQYETPSGTILDTSRSLGTVPVWDNCNHPIGSGTNGQTAAVLGFVEVFVDGMGNSTVCSGGRGGQKDFVEVHMVNATPCGSGTGGSGGGSGGGTGGTGTGPFAVPVQLIKH